MNVLSLPDELIANIVKYKAPCAIVMLRKLNNRINMVALTRQSLHKLHVKQFLIGEFEDRPYPRWNITIELGKPLSDAYNLPIDGFVHYYSLSSSYTELLEKYILKISCIKELLFFDDVDLSPKLFDTLEQHKRLLKNCTSLKFHKVSIKTSANRMRQFIDACPRLEDIIVEMTPTYMNVINQTVMRNRPWKDIEIRELSYNRIDAPELNDQFLMNVVPNCKKFIFHPNASGSHFTFAGVHRLLEECLTNVNGPVDWRLHHIDLVNWNLEEAETLIQALPNVSMQRYPIQYSEGPFNKYWLQLTKNGQKSSISFSIRMPEEEQNDFNLW